MHRFHSIVQEGIIRNFRCHGRIEPRWIFRYDATRRQRRFGCDTHGTGRIGSVVARRQGSARRAVTVRRIQGHGRIDGAGRIRTKFAAKFRVGVIDTIVIDTNANTRTSCDNEEGETC
jgi:hypothetical protein